MDHDQEAAWRTAVARVLKGADFDANLVSRSRDGLAIGPLYPKADAAAPAPWRDIATPVAVIQRADHPDAAEARRIARAEIESGASGLALVFARAPAARGFGLQATTADDIAALLDALIDAVPLRCELPSSDGEQLLLAIVGGLERQDLIPSALDIDFGFDPIGAWARTGRGADFGKRLHDVAGTLRARGYATGLFRADGRPYHEAGASEAQELAAVLATGVAYLRALEDEGLEAARDAIGFTLAADADQFLTIAKFRALRRLWASIETACGLDPKPIHLHAETAWRMLARRDPHTNLLRNAIAAASAILGGADSLTVLPHTSVLGTPDEFARRLARNTPLVLLEESNLGRVADPAAGAGGFEALTEALCSRAWALFQGLEREGGLSRALAEGSWQAQIARVRAARDADRSAGRALLVGVTAFGSAHEGAAPSARTSEGSAPAFALLSQRDAEHFEIDATASSTRVPCSGEAAP